MIELILYIAGIILGLSVLYAVVRIVFGALGAIFGGIGSLFKPKTKSAMECFYEQDEYDNYEDYINQWS